MRYPLCEGEPWFPLTPSSFCKGGVRVAPMAQLKTKFSRTVGSLSSPVSFVL
jgi:hypothetical protein